MAEAIPKNRLLAEQTANSVDRVWHGRRSAGPLERKMPSGLSERICAAVAEAASRHLKSGCDQAAQDVRLMP